MVTRILMMLATTLSGCAAPPGADSVNPVCVFRCVVSHVDVTRNPALTTLTTTGTGTGGAGAVRTSSRTSSETNTEEN